MIGNVAVRKSTKISIITILSYLLFGNLITLLYFESSLYTLIQYVMLVPLIIYCFVNISKIIQNQWKVLAIVLSIFFLIVLSSYVNKVYTYNLRAAIYYGMFILTMFTFLAIAAYKKRLVLVLNVGKTYLFFLVILNDILMFALPEQFYNIYEREIGTCLLGNKFNVAYAHLMFLFMSIVLEKKIRKQKLKVVLYAIFVLGICIYVDCATVILAVLAFVILYFIESHIRDILAKPIVVLTFFFVAAVLLILFDGVLSLAPIQNFITNVLHRDSTLTGRLEVYPYIFRLFDSHKWLGYGYATSIFSITTTWYANAQNAFWDFVIDYGMITMGFLVILLIVVVKSYNRTRQLCKEDTILWMSFAMIYIYLFMGIAEIVYNKQFFFYIALLNALCLGKYQDKIEQGIGDECRKRN